MDNTPAPNVEMWNELVFKDRGFLSGERVFSVCKELIERYELNYYYLDDLVISGAPDLEEGLVLSDWKQFLSSVRKATQCDWAFFVFFEDAPIVNGDALIELIRKSTITIRLVDGLYFYIYSKLFLGSLFPEDELNRNYRIVNFSDLEIPY